MTYQTPYFVIDENQLMKDFQMLKSSLETSWGNYRIGYSFKTNSLPWLVTFLKAGGVMAEVVSDDEYSLAGALGFQILKLYTMDRSKNVRRLNGCCLQAAS